jgi:hypothetical protein
VHHVGISALVQPPGLDRACLPEFKMRVAKDAEAISTGLEGWLGNAAENYSTWNKRTGNWGGNFET